MTQSSSLRLMLSVLLAFVLLTSIIPGTSIADGNGSGSGTGNPLIPPDSGSAGESYQPTIDPIMDPSLAAALYLAVVTL